MGVEDMNHMVHHLFMGVMRYRDFIFDSIRRDFQLRYQNSFLGSLWLIIQPVAMIAVYTLVFSEVMRARMGDMQSPYAYSIYLCAGILTWGLFADTLGRLVNVFLTHANIIKKLNFPRICLPIIAATSAFLSFMLIFGLFLIFLSVTDNFPGIVLVSILPVLLLQMLFTVGLGVWLGVMNVFIRDVGQMLTIVLQFWFWFTPIVYLSNTLPLWVQNFQRWNPMTHLIKAYQDILLYHHAPDWPSLYPVWVLALLLILMAWSVFKKNAGDLVDHL